MIEIKVQDKGIESALATLRKKLTDMTPLMRQIAGDMKDAVAENFNQGGRPKWPALSPRTIARRRGGGVGARPLIDTGGLQDNISSRYTSSSAIVGANKTYAIIQHFGGKAGRGRKVTIPARPFLKLTEGDLAGIRARIQRYLMTP